MQVAGKTADMTLTAMQRISRARCTGRKFSVWRRPAARSNGTPSMPGAEPVMEVQHIRRGIRPLTHALAYHVI